MFLIPASPLQLVWSNWLNFLCTELYNCSTSTFFLWASQIALNSTHPRSRLYPDIPRPDAPVIYTGAFPILTVWLGRRSICYISNTNNFQDTTWFQITISTVLENDTQTPAGLWHTHGSPNLGQKTRPYNNQQQKKRICIIVDFAVPADHRIKLKECEKKDKYHDLTREFKRLWNMSVTIVPIVIGAFGKVTKGLLKGLEELEVGRRVETIQLTALLKTARILRRVLCRIKITHTSVKRPAGRQNKTGRSSVQPSLQC